MIILTGANSDYARTNAGAIRDNIQFRFSAVIARTARNAAAFGYVPDVYDLGDLGMGRPFEVADSDFGNKGFYEKEVRSGYKSRSLFKPALVKKCIQEHDDLVVYIDGDAELRDRIDEIATDDYDVGVTVRDPIEMQGDWYEEYFDIVKYVNAGVIFFNPGAATSRFLDRWETLTEQVGNDQMALNKLTCADHRPEIGSIDVIDGVRIKYFPCLQYNFYYFEEKYPLGAKILNYKGIVRHFYPFDWKARLYCATVVPAKRAARAILRKS